MNKSTTALAALITAAGLAGGATLTAQAHPSSLLNHTASHHTSQVALTRLHAMLQTPDSVAHPVIVPNDGGMTIH